MAEATSYAGSPLVALLLAWQDDARDLLVPLHPSSHPEGVLPSRELTVRTEAIRRLRWTMIPREALKQRYLWPSLRRRLVAGQPSRPNGGQIVDQVRRRKRAFEQELIRLRWADERSNHFEHQLAVLIEQLESYIDFQDELLPRIGTQIPAGEQDWIHAQLTASHRFLPVQPHPDAPWLAAVLSPVTAVLDRARDRLTTAPG